MITMPIFDFGFYMQYIASGLLNENRKIIRFFKKNGLDEVGYIVAVLWNGFIVVAYCHHYGLFSMISVIMSIKTVWQYSVAAVIMIYKKQWSFKKWYYESLNKAHIMPYQRLGIRL